MGTQKRISRKARTFDVALQLFFILIFLKKTKWLGNKQIQIVEEHILIMETITMDNLVGAIQHLTTCLKLVKPMNLSKLPLTPNQDLVREDQVLFMIPMHTLLKEQHMQEGQHLQMLMGNLLR